MRAIGTAALATAPAISCAAPTAATLTGIARPAAAPAASASAIVSTAPALATVPTAACAAPIASAVRTAPAPATAVSTLLVTCCVDISDQHRVARAFITAAIRLGPALPTEPDRLPAPAYLGRHRRTEAAHPSHPPRAVRP